MKQILCLVALVGVLGVVGQVSASSKVTTFIDEQHVNEIALEVCENDDSFKRQIARISTIQALATHLRGVSGIKKLEACKSKYGQSIEDLNAVVSSELDLCSAQKIGQLEQYHRDYVSTVSKFKDARKEAGKAAPHLIKVFFMQYASRVSTLCSEVATSMLKESSGQLQDREWVKKVSADLGGLEQDLASLKSYDDIFLLWNLMASLPSVMSGTLNKYVRHDKATKVTVEVSEVENMHKLQEACRNNAKPFYSIAVLPVVRLIDIGYYPESETLLHQLQEDDFSRVLYSFTVLCENFLPIRFAENKDLPSGKTAMIETSQAIIKYGEVTEEEVSVTVASKVTVQAAAISDYVINETQEGAYASGKRIKSQVKSRGKVMKHMIKRIIHVIKKRPASTFDALVVGDTEVPMDQYVSEVNEQEIPDIVEEENEVALARRRRSVKSILLAPFNALGFVGFLVLYFLLVYVPNEIFFPVIFASVMAMYFTVVVPLRYISSKLG